MMTPRKKATQVIAAQEAEQVVSPRMRGADSAIRISPCVAGQAGRALECPGLKVYWETAEDHVTIFKNSRSII